MNKIKAQILSHRNFAFLLGAAVLGFSACTKPTEIAAPNGASHTIPEAKIVDEGCRVDSPEPNCSPTPSISASPIELSPKSGTQH